MNIQLGVLSPAARLDGLDRAIERLDLMQAKMDALAAFKPINIRVNLSAVGFEKAEAAMASMVANVEGLAAMLESVGRADLGKNLREGLLSAGEVAVFAKAKVQSLGVEVAALRTQTIQAQGKFEGNANRANFASAENLDNLSKQRRLLQDLMDTERQRASELGAFQRIVGAADAMAGEAGRAAAKESELARASGESAAALSEQAAIAKGKKATMRDLGDETAKVSAAEKGLARDAKESAAASEAAAAATGKLLSERYAMIEGERKLVQTKQRGESGQTITISGSGEDQSIVEDISHVQRLKDSFKQLDREYAERTRILKEMGASEREHIGLLREQASAMQKLSGGSELKEEAFVQDFQRKAAQLQAQAAAMEAKLVAKEKIASLRGSAGALDQQFRQRATDVATSNGSERERIALLREQATAMDDLIAKSGQQNDAFAVEYRRRADLLRLQAARAERSLNETETVDQYKAAAQAIRAEFANEGVTAGAQRRIDLWQQEAQVLRQLGETLSVDSKEANNFRAQLDAAASRLETRAYQETAAADRRAADAKRQVADFQKQAGLFGPDATFRTKRTETGTGATEETTIRRDVNGMRETVRLYQEFDAAGRLVEARTASVAEKLAETGRQAGWAGRTFLTNTGNFLAWSSSAGVAFAAFDLLNRGMGTVIRTGRQFGTLQTIFAGTQEQVRALRDETLSLAVAQGRTSEEGMDAALRWSRLRLGQAQTQEAIAVSLQAANVAEIESAQAAEQLSSVYAAYEMQVSGLRTSLNELNTVSNLYNVTNRDLLAGVARSSAIAAQAKVPFSELIGIIGSGVGRTGRTGAELGNAVKSTIVSLSNPALQEFLRKDFKIDVRSESSGDIKNFSETLRELYVRYQELTDAERQELLQKVGGKQQASRLQAILDGYIQSQYLAIRAQSDLNSAERENQNIRATLMSQLASLGAMFDKLAVDSADFGRNSVLSLSLNDSATRTVEFLTNLLKVVDVLPGGLVPVVGLLGLMAVKLAVSATMMADGSRKAGFLAASGKHVAQVWREMAAALDAANQRLITSGTLLGRVGAAVRGTGTGGAVNNMRALATFVVGMVPQLLKMAAGFVAVSLVMEGVNQLARWMQGEFDEGTRKLAGFNVELEKTKGLVEAGFSRERLGRTLSQAIRALAARNPQAAVDAVGQFGEVSSMDPKLGARNRAELETLIAQGRIAEARLRIDEISNAIHKETVMNMQVELAQRAKVLETLRAQMALLEGRQRANPTNERRDKIGELRKQEAELIGQQTKTMTDLAETETEVTDSVRMRVKQYERLLEVQMRVRTALAGALPFFTERGKQGADEAAARGNLEEVNKQIEAKRRLRSESEQAKTEDSKRAQKEIQDLEEAIGKTKALILEREGIQNPDRKTKLLARKYDAGDLSEFGDSGESIASKRLGQIEMDLGRQAIRNNRTYGTSDLDALTEMVQKKRELLEASQAEKAGVTNRLAEELKLLETQKEQLEVKLASAELERRIAEQADAVQRGVRTARLADLSGAIGRNDTEQIVNRGFSLSKTAEFSAAGAREDAEAGDVTSQIERQATVLQSVQSVEQLRVEVAERLARVNAEIVNEKIRQNEEASKAIQMASREEQLAAAMLAKYTQRRGRFSSEQFQFLSADTRRVAEQFTPNALPREFQNREQELRRERAMGPAAMKALDDLAEKLSVLAKSMPEVRQDFAARSGQQGGPQVAVNNPQITFRFADEFRQAVQVIADGVGAQLRTEIASMRSTMDSFMRSQGVGAAQGAAVG